MLFGLLSPVVAASSAGGVVSGVRSVVEAAVGQRTAESFVEEQKEQRHESPFRCAPVGVTRAVALQEGAAPGPRVWSQEIGAKGRDFGKLSASCESGR